MKWTRSPPMSARGSPPRSWSRNDDRAREQDPAVLALRESGLEQAPPHLGAADLEAVLGQDPLRLVDDAADQLGLEEVQAGSHRRSIMPDRWWRLEAVPAARLRAMGRAPSPPRDAPGGAAAHRDEARRRLHPIA